MKQTPLILSVIAALVAVAALVLSLVNPSKTAKAVAEPEDGEFPASGEIVYVKVDSLIMQYDMFSDLQSEFQAKAQSIQDDLNKKGRQLESDMKSFENQINKGLLTRSNAEQQQNALLQRQQDLQNLANQRQQELSEEEYVLNNQVMDAILTYLEAFNATHRYAAIINATNAVLISDDALDITHEIVEGLNAEYIKTRNSNNSAK